MNAERFRQLLDSYGAESARWPAELRSEMLVFLDDNVEARSWLQEARELDALLDSYSPGSVDLTDRIMDALPLSTVDRLIDWLLPSMPSQWWRPAVAGAMPLVLGLAIGLGGVTADTGEGLDWELQEQALMMAPGSDWYE